MLAADYGAHITYGEEIIDHKIIKCERRVNGLFASILCACAGFAPILSLIFEIFNVDPIN